MEDGINVLNGNLLKKIQLIFVKYKKDPDNEKNDLITYKTVGGKVVEIKTWYYMLDIILKYIQDIILVEF